MHWDIKSSLISPSLESFTPKRQSERCDEISCCTPIFDGFQSGHLGDAQVRSWTQRRPLLSSAPGEWWSNRRHKWHFSESNNSANKCDGGETLFRFSVRFWRSLISLGWMWQMRCLGRWDYIQHVAMVVGATWLKTEKYIKHKLLIYILYIYIYKKNTVKSVSFFCLFVFAFHNCTFRNRRRLYVLK